MTLGDHKPSNAQVEILVHGLAGLGIGLGFLIWFFFRQQRKQSLLDSITAENRLLRQEIKDASELEKDLRESLRQAEIDRTKSMTLNQELNKKLELQIQEQENLAKQMQDRFENLANKILEQKSSKFTQANKENLKNVLEPLDKDIRAFRRKVEEMHEKDLSQHASLKEFLGSLLQAQSQLSEEARNLTTALKGDSKKQGDWGEFILERTLEASGLVKGQEFLMQETFDRQRPDAIIRLPEGRAIVVDSKVSLTAYERSVSLQEEAPRKEAIKEHLLSVKKHVDELSNKDYSAIERIKAPDFVLLFIPVEPAFGAALNADPNLYQYAFDRKIVIVTSTTLMATIKTVANLWKLEKQNKHSNEIARQAGNLYDKFIGLLENLEDIGKALQKAADIHEKAIGQLSTGTGNLIGRVEKLRSLGIRAKKELPASFTHGIEKADSKNQEIPSFAEKDRESEKEKNELHSG